MGFPFKQFFSALTTLAPVILMVVPGGAALAPFVPLIVKAVADAEKDPGTTGPDKRAFVLAQVANGAAIANQAKPGVVNEVQVVEAAGHYVDAVIGSINAVKQATIALPTQPTLVDTARTV
jgi:hypothetical protein